MLILEYHCGGIDQHGERVPEKLFVSLNELRQLGTFNGPFHMETLPDAQWGKPKVIRLSFKPRGEIRVTLIEFVEMCKMFTARLEFERHYFQN